MIDQNTFLTQEFPDHPIRLAGVRVNQDEAEYVERFIRRGATLRIGYTSDEMRMIADDTYGTIRATVWADNLNVNRWLIDKGYGTERETDYSPAGVHARFTPWEITKGTAWERFAHLDTPLHTRFLAVRSPLETYERKELYGKNFQRWRVMDQLGPTFESYWAKGPVGGALLGGALGFFFGSSSIGRLASIAIGATIGGAGGIMASADEIVTGETWIPRRRRIEREINQYFDILEYLKHKRLFEQTRRRAIFHEGIDPLEFIDRHAEEGDERMMMRRQLEELKREEVIHGGADEQKLKRINEMLRMIADTKEAQAIGPYTVQALMYHTAKSSTLYGVDPYGPWMDIFRALPSKDRPFFPEFMKASPEERERILEVVPEDQRRIYQAKWGMEVDDRPALEKYFKERYLPSEDWAGWSPDVHLEDIKYKVIKNEALDMTEFGIWEDAAKRAQMLQLDAPNIHKPNQDVRNIERELRKITSGMGLEDVIMEIISLPDKMGIYVDVEISDDMMERFREALHEDPLLV